MPSNLPVVVPPIRGDDAYARFLDRMEREAKKRGHTGEGRTALVDLALATLGLQWGIKAPRRAAPRGTNRHGEPKQSGG